MMKPVLDLVDNIAAKADIPGFDWVKLLCSLLVCHDAFEGFIDYRQFQVLRNKSIPLPLKDHVNSEELAKTQDYERAKLKYKTYHRFFKLAVNIAWYHFMLIGWQWHVSSDIVGKLAIKRFSGEITKAIVFSNFANIVSSLLEAPWDFYHQFVLEEEFGFNKSTYGLFISDFFKKQLVSTAVNSVLIGGLGVVVAYFGNTFFIYAALFIVAFILLFSVISPLILDPLFNKYEPLENGELKDAINALAARLNFPLTRIYVQDSSKRTSHSNAYFIGLPWYKQIVLFDNLIENSTTDEIVAVLGHELGHWKLNHISKHLSLNSIIILFVFTLFAVFINNQSLYASLGLSEPHWVIGLAVFGDIMSPAQAPLKFLLTYTTRKHEYDADEFSTNLGYGRQLASGLIKLAKDNLSSLHADPLYAAYHHSHPIMPTRLEAIEEYVNVYETKQK